MVCRVRPYEGNEPYIFFSYCHSNEEDVYPIIEAMGKNGYRIWYDDGIHPGEDWPEVIAEHLIKCSACMVAITQEFAASHNCRNELNTAINNNKPLLPLVLEGFQMSLGMSLQLSSFQRINRWEIRTEREFYGELYSSPILDICRGNVSLIDRYANDAIEAEKEEIINRRIENEEEKRIRSVADSFKDSNTSTYENDSGHSLTSHDLYGRTGDNLKISGTETAGTEFSQKRPVAHKEHREEANSFAERAPDITEKEKDDFPKYGSSSLIDDSVTKAEVDESVTVSETSSDVTTKEGKYSSKSLLYAVLIRKSDGKAFEVNVPKTRIGNSTEKCDIVIKSRDEIHAEIIFNSGMFLLVDRDSEEGTFLNGKRSEGMGPQKMGDSAEISFGKEEFVFLSGESRESVESLIKKTVSVPLAILVSVSDRKIYKLSSDRIRIGTDKKKCGIVFDDKSVDYIHAEIAYDGSTFTVRDLGSDTGTFVGRTKLSDMNAAAIKNKDEIYIGSKKCIFLDGENAVRMLDSKMIGVLECYETNESMAMLDMPFELGRHYQWPGGTFSDMHASRKYGSICQEKRTFSFICDKKASTNGITHNEKEIMPGEKIILKDGDKFKMGIRYTVSVHISKLEAEGE